MRTTLCFAIVFASAPLAAIEKYCFENAGPKGKMRVIFDIEQSRVQRGTYTVTSAEDTKSAKTFHFAGTRSGTILVIKFRGKTPYTKPKDDPEIIWTSDGKRLTIPMYGKNPKTQKSGDFDTVFNWCRR